MAQVYAFVDAPTATPTTMLDLDDDNPLTVIEAIDTSPPGRRISAFGSAARDGDVVAQMSYPNRQLRLTLEFKRGSTAEMQMTAIQAVAQMLREPRWLKWQPEGIAKPVFFRTKFGDLQVNDEVISATPRGRTLSLTVTADPFGYGLPETGQVTITNDPTSGTNRMTVLLPTVKGDVASPLWFHFAQNAAAWSTLLSTSCVPVGSTGGIPVFTGAFDTSVAISGWAQTSTADATAISGTRKRWTKSSGGITTADVGLTTPLVNVPRGDYRLLARAQSSVGTAALAGWISDPSVAVTASTKTKTIPGTTWGWVDLGVVRAPLGPRKTPLLDQGHASKTYATVRLTLPANGTLDLDELILIPVGKDDALDTRTAFTAGVLTGTDDLYVDGVNEFAYMRVAATDTHAPATVLGGFPRVIPNADCHLNFMRLVGAAADDKALATVIDWSYLPMYLYGRPTAT